MRKKRWKKQRWSDSQRCGILHLPLFSLILPAGFLFSLLGGLFLAPLAAEDLSGTEYKVRQGTFCVSGFAGGTGSYKLQDIVGVNTGQIMYGSLYAINPGFFYLNSPPLVTVASYNDGQATDDETPTLVWTYYDADKDTQKRFQLQVGHEDFATPVIDTGVVSSSTTSYTTGILPRTEERTAYRWRVRVHDGFGWSGWAVADSGFYLTKGEFEITGLTALTAPGGEPIPESAWQRDNDPYFYWEPPPEGIEVLGYSYALDELPDEEIDTTYTAYYFPTDGITDGSHTFYVRAQRSSGLWGDPVAFDIWVDTTAPTVVSLTPTLGGVISVDQPEIGAGLSDAASGVDPATIEMRINQTLVEPEYDPETGRITFIPSIPLSDGELTVYIEVQDLVGNAGVPLSWSFIIDTEGPSGSLLINNGDEMTTTNVVTLNITAEDAQSAVVEMMLSNDGVFDTEIWEPFTTRRKNWILPAVSGLRKVYAKVKDEAGNISDVFFDDIQLVIIAPETFILSGPSGIIQSQSAQFTFGSSLADCVFSYKFDNEDWSDWSPTNTVSRSGLSEGNHYFMVRAAKDLNQDGLLQLDEVDPTAALRVWTVSFTGLLEPPTTPESPIRHWEEE